MTRQRKRLGFVPFVLNFEAHNTLVPQYPIELLNDFSLFVALILCEILPRLFHIPKVILCEVLPRLFHIKDA